MIQREIKYLHPLVAKWLSENDYVFQHEVKMPEYGRADFVARGSDESALIIECKLEMLRHSRESILQLLGYCHQLGEDVRGAIATLDTRFSEHAVNLCRYYNVDLIQVDTSEYQCRINVGMFKDKMSFLFNTLSSVWLSKLQQDNVPSYMPYSNRDKLMKLLISKVQITQRKIEFVDPEQAADQLELEEYILIAIAAHVLIELHCYRNSYGVNELAEDIDDVQPIIDAARPEIQNVFSKKPRRLAGEDKIDRLK